MSQDLALVGRGLGNLPMPTDSMDAYVAAINRFPLLSAEEERALGTQWQDHGELPAAQRLVLSHLRFVVHIARSYSGYGLPLGDLVQEGNIGLMKAVKRFDPRMGVRLVSFAVHWIRAEIHEFIVRNWRTVRVATTKPQRKLFFKLRGSKKHLGWFTADEVEGVAKDLGVKPETVREMESRLGGHDVAFDPMVDADNEDTGGYSPSEYLHNEDEDPARRFEAEDSHHRQHEALTQAIEGLDARSQAIIQRRWLNEPKATLQELADEYGVTAERIRQLEKSAMMRLRGAMAA